MEPRFKLEIKTKLGGFGYTTKSHVNQWKKHVDYYIDKPIVGEDQAKQILLDLKNKIEKDISEAQNLSEWRKAFIARRWMGRSIPNGFSVVGRTYKPFFIIMLIEDNGNSH